MIESTPTTKTTAATREGHLNGTAKNGAVAAPINEEYAYRFPYDTPSAYSHVVDSIRQYIAPGVIVDLGAGAGTIGAPLAEAGFAYVGVEKHRGALRILKECRIRNYACDLADTDALRSVLDEIPDINAFCLLDVIEHLHEPHALLRLLSEYALAHHAPYLFISVPNVAHRDVALNLLRGQWNVTRYGLLDKTHVAYYTRQTLQHLFEESGWELVARNDFVRDESDQYDPESLLHTDTLLSAMLRYTSDLFNPDHDVHEFIWMLKPVHRPTPSERSPDPADDTQVTHPLVSILIRTQGTRNELLMEALFAAYAQDSDDYEIVVCFHNPDDADGTLLQRVRDLVSSLPVALRRRIRMIVCTGVGRSAPLNALFEDARGAYLTVLDDDDLLFPRHVSTIAKGVEQYGIGPMFQTFAVQRMVDVRKEKPRSPEFGFTAISALEPKRPTATYPYTVESIEMLWAKPFDPLKQQYANAVHVSCFIIPKRLIEQTHLRFRNDFDYGEDWQFWMEASQVLNVVTLPEITGVQNVRTNGTNTVGNTDLQPEWITAHKRRFAVQEEHPLILDGRTAQLIYRRHIEETTKKADMDFRLAEAEREYKALSKEYDKAHEAFEKQSAWALSMERQLLARRGGLLRRVARRLLRR
ncbi:MAG: methyltransferase domain-containing protein [Thermomicrobiales bacterium]